MSERGPGPSFEEMMNQAIQEELDKGEPLDDRGARPIADGEIKPPSLEERLRMRRQRSETEEARLSAEAAANDDRETGDEPESEKTDDEIALPSEKPAGRELAAQAKEAVLAKRQQQLEASFTALQERVKSGEDVGINEKKVLLEQMLRDAVAGMRPALEVGISKLGREVAGPETADKYEAGLNNLLENFMSNNLSTMTHFDNLLKMQPDAKLVRTKMQERFVAFLTKTEANPLKAVAQKQEQLRPRPAATPAAKKQSPVGEAIKPFLEDIKTRTIGWKRQDDRRKKTGTDDR